MTGAPRPYTDAPAARQEPTPDCVRQFRCASAQQDALASR